jgi:crossover junction endodeoxyribonuclease RuvC
MSKLSGGGAAAKRPLRPTETAGSALRGPAVRVLGIDPGLASTGWGVIECADGKLRHIAHGCISTTARETMGDRVLKIALEVESIAETWKPSAAGMESIFFWRNVTSALPVAEVRGAIRFVLARMGLAVADFSPTAIKQAVVGSSRAEKEQVQAMVKLLLGLKEEPRPDHAADALAAAICRWHHETDPSLPSNGE